MSERAYDETFEQLAAGYFDEVLDDTQIQQLKQLLAEDDRYVKRFAELAQLQQMIESEITYRRQAQRFHLSKSPNDSSAANALAELASLYEDELQNPMNFAAWREEQAIKAQHDRHRLRRKRFVITSAIAAVLALAGVLAIQFIANNPAPQTITDNTPTQNKPAESAQPIPRDQPVATLTNTHNATWGRPASAGPEHPPTPGSKLQPGDALAAGQRLNLTAGFAEITTARGAVAILEAPATFELLDNDNAIRLHTGKLVGICETPSSKGFLVRTPHMDITDLGTRFGVDVTRADGTQVHVFEGEIDVSAQSSVGRQWIGQRLTAGQAMSAQVAGELSAVSLDQQRFESTMFYADLGSITWFDYPPPGLIPESESLQVFCEAKGLTLQQNVIVDINPDDSWPTQIERGTYHVPAGTTVDIYLVHLDTPGDQPLRGDYRVRFNGRLLGVIGTDAGLNETDTLVSASDQLATYASRGITPHDDTIMFAEDGRSLNLSFRVAKATDHVRVLVQSDNSNQPNTGETTP